MPLSPARCRSCCGSLPPSCRLSPKKSGRGGKADPIHRAAWPRPEELFELAGRHTDADVRTLELSAAVLGAIRKKKSEEQRPLKTPVMRAIVRLPEQDRALLASAEADVRAAGLIATLDLKPGDSLDVIVELAPSETTAGEQRR